MSRNSAKAKYYATINRSLRKYNISLEEFKSNPVSLFSKDTSFRRWVYTAFQPNTDFTWYNKPFNWSSSIPNSLYSTIENENIVWFNQLIANSFFDDNEDDLFDTEKSEGTGPVLETPNPKKQKTSNGQEVETSNQDQSKSESQLEKSLPAATGTNTGEKRKSDSDAGPSSKSTKTVNQIEPPTNAGSSAVGTTQLASGIAENTGNKEKQSNPTGAGEVDQQKDQQLQTSSGNAHNERGTVEVARWSAV